MKLEDSWSLTALVVTSHLDCEFEPFKASISAQMLSYHIYKTVLRSPHCFLIYLTA